jgi:Concanavalin A-like lectin/glucanases superfamily/Glutamine cyclotransferase
VLAQDPDYGKNTVLLHGNGDHASTLVVDQAGNVWTVNGNAQISTTAPKYGTGALVFDGNGDYLAMTRSGVLGAGDLTVEAWVYIDDHASDHEIFCVSSATGDFSFFDFLFETNTNGSLRASVRNNGATNCDFNTPAGVVPTLAWTHVAFTVEGSAARVRVNGVVVASDALSGTRGNPNDSCRVGLLSGWSGFLVPRWFKGRVDDLRVTKGLCRYPGAGPATPPVAQLPSFRVPVFDSRFTASGANDAQGVATDGTHVWFSNSTTLYKYTTAGSLVISRVVTGDNPTDKAQINGVCYRGGKLYVSAAKFVGGVGTSWIVEYDPDTLTYLTHRQLVGDHFSEGIAWYNGDWWVVFHANMYVRRYDANWVQRGSYALGFSITGSSGGYGAGTGYDGITWFGDYLLCNVHEIYDQKVLDVYAWNGSGLDQVARLVRPTAAATQGIAIDPSDPTVLWFAERNPSGADSVAKTRLV